MQINKLHLTPAQANLILHYCEHAMGYIIFYCNMFDLLTNIAVNPSGVLSPY